VTPLPILIFCDGACSGNPGPGGYGAIIATPDGHVRELGGKQNPTTNNAMELHGLIVALEAIAQKPGEVAVHTDSTYVIRGITQWIWAWRKRGWITAEGKPVANADRWQRLFAVVAKRESGGGKISWHYVRGHVGVPGNERVDQIAVAYSQGKWIELYDGPLLKYGTAIHDIPDDTSLPEQRERVEKVAAFSYLSLINGKLERHATWKECEARVKGRPGAKFKKAMSPDEERKIIESWGI